MNSKFDANLVFGETKRYECGCDTTDANRLVGLDSIKEELQHSLHLLFNPHQFRNWSQKHYKKEIKSLGLMKDIVPLIIFEGDVGTGKTALAEAIAPIMANKYGYEVQVLKMSTQVRGKGFVGEMGTLLGESFQHVEKQATKADIPTLLIIDEADSLLTSRGESGQHHEDKAGVNTILQNLDQLKHKEVPLAVIAITNRFDVLDPAIKRRCTSHFTFTRPSIEQREHLFKDILGDTDLADHDFKALAEATQVKHVGENDLTFSYADLTLKIIIPEIRNAMNADTKITLEPLLERIENTNPSPRL